MFAGDCVRVVPLEGGLVEMCFDRAGEAINKLDDKAVAEFGRAVDAIAADASVRGVQRFNEIAAAEKRVSVTEIQTVGVKGYDGFALALVVAEE